MKHIKKLIIEDTSDCATCTARDKDDWETLRTVRVKCLDGLTCPECGREFSLLVERDENFKDN